MHYVRTACVYGAIWFLAVGPLGCSRGEPDVVPVTGELTYKGKAVPSALINFKPEYGRQTWAITDKDGKFKVNYDRHQDGIVVGKNKVWFEHRPRSPAEQDAVAAGKAAPLSPELREFFIKYNYENSKLEVQIDKDTRELPLKLE